MRSCSQINISPPYYLKRATVLQAPLFVQNIFLTAAASGIFCLNCWYYVKEAGLSQQLFCLGKTITSVILLYETSD